jgi:hypothetical protein
MLHYGYSEFDFLSVEDENRIAGDLLIANHSAGLSEYFQIRLDLFTEF